MKPTQSHRNAAFVGFAILASSLAVGAGASYASSNTSAPTTSAPSDTAPPDTAPPDTSAPAEPGAVDVEVDHVDCPDGGFMITEDEFVQDFATMDADKRAELVAEMTASANGLKQELDAAGVTYTIDVDTVTGVAWPMPDLDDPANQAKLDSWTSASEVAAGETVIGIDDEALSSDDVDICVEVWSEEFSDAEFAEMFNALSAEEQAAMVAQMQQGVAQMIEALDAEGVEYTTEVDPTTGVSWPVVGGDVDLSNLGPYMFSLDCDDDAVDGDSEAPSSVPSADESDA